jgi:hypothetical protein
MRPAESLAFSQSEAESNGALAGIASTGESRPAQEQAWPRFRQSIATVVRSFPHVALKRHQNRGGLMPVTKLPDMVACTDAVLASADAELEDALLTVTLRTEQGERYMLPLSERAITQMLEIISECHRTTDFLGQEEDPEIITLQ